MKIYTILLLLVLACSESPPPPTGGLYYDNLDELYGEHEYFKVWDPPRLQRPGYNKNTYLFPFEPVNLRVALEAPDHENHIIGWRLDKSKAWVSGEYRDFYILDRHSGTAAHTHNCDYTGYD